VSRTGPPVQYSQILSSWGPRVALRSGSRRSGSPEVGKREGRIDLGTELNATGKSLGASHRQRPDYALSGRRILGTANLGLAPRRCAPRRQPQALCLSPFGAPETGSWRPLWKSITGSPHADRPARSKGILSRLDRFLSIGAGSPSATPRARARTQAARRGCPGANALRTPEARPGGKRTG